jgi:hypothetical protein
MRPSPAGGSRWAALRPVTRHAFVVVPFLFYGLTAARTIGMSDTAILIFDIQSLNLSTHVNGHNLTLLLGKLFSLVPLGDLALRGNLMSVFSGGLAVTLFYFLLWRCLRTRLAAAMTSSVLMVSHSMWWHSTITESYAINACLVIVALHLLESYRRRATDGPILGLIALSGLAVFQHAQLGVIGLATLVVAASHFKRLWSQPEGPARAFSSVARGALVGALGLAPYGLTLLHDARRAASLSKAAAAASGGEFRGIMFEWASGLGVVDTLLLTVVQFPSPFLLVVGAGVLLWLQRWGATASTAAVGVIFAVNTAFFALYHTWDRFAFLLISFVVLAFWGGFAVDEMVVESRAGAGRLRRWALVGGFALSVLLPPYVYAHAAEWTARPDSVWAQRFGRSVPCNTIDPVVYQTDPDKRRYTDIEEFSTLLFERLPPDAIYVTDDAFFYTLQYYLVHAGRRPDLAVALVNSWGISGWGLSPEELTVLLTYAYECDLPLFLERLDAPFDQLVGTSGTVYAFERFDLDARRWVYRLRTSGQGCEGSPSSIPAVRGTFVGHGFGGPRPEIVRFADADAELTVYFEFEENSRAFPVTYRLIAPDGHARFTSPLFVVPQGSGSAGWLWEYRGLLTPGPWRVEVRVGSTPVGSTSFTVI